MADLLSRIKAVTSRALASGALQPIATHTEVVDEKNVSFLLRVLDNLKHKEQARERLQRAGGHEIDPFLPYEEALYVGELPPRHRCLLNKFNVVEHHALIVTRDFEPQTDLLNTDDFRALAQGMAQAPFLAFYNGGQVAGASQRHKHLQLVPLPMAPFEPLPFSSLLASLPSDSPQRCEALPFRHVLIGLPGGIPAEAGEAALRLHSAYHALRAALSLNPDDPYNLLLTDDWMMLVPRRVEKWQGISFNALAFCGAILVRDEAQAELLKREGVMQALQAVT